MLILKGKTRKGKNRIKEWGKKWLVIEQRPSVECYNMEPGTLLEPANPPEGRSPTVGRRWIRTLGDADFEVIRPEPSPEAMKTMDYIQKHIAQHSDCSGHCPDIAAIITIALEK